MDLSKNLKRIIDKNSDSEYLQSLKIECEQSFKNNCPLSTYDSIERNIANISTLGKNIFTTSKIIAFSKSSGTTSRSKFVPMNKDAIQANFTAGKSMLSYYIAAYPDSKIFEGKNFSLTGSFEKHGNIIKGDVSSLFAYFLSPWYRPFRVPNMEIATIADWNQKLDVLIPILAKTDVRWIAGVPSWMSIVIDKLEEYTQRPIKAIWPHLEVYFYGGVGIQPFEKYFYSKLPNIRLWQTYNASEGFFGLQMEKETYNLGLLTNTNTYYEFIEVSSIYDKSPAVKSLNELEIDKIYELVISNSSGLYRYRMGDLLQIKSIDPLRFVICGRTQNSINIFGEELMVINTETAIALLNREMNFRIKDYTIAPIIQNNSGRHHWQIEFYESPKDLNLFANRLDDILRNLNSDYDAKRYQDWILKPLTIEVLKKNSIDLWLEKNNRKTVQAKIPKLWKDRSIQKQLSDIACT